MEVATRAHGAQISDIAWRILSALQESSRIRELASGPFLAPPETMGYTGCRIFIRR
jgi:hypothetical protein